jgi:hypothetical protein
MGETIWRRISPPQALPDRVDGIALLHPSAAIGVDAADRVR